MELLLRVRNVKIHQDEWIRHIFTPAHHPSSNGVLERVVQTIKEFLKRKQQGSLDTRMKRILFPYRTTQHSTTGKTAKILTKRVHRVHLDLLHSKLTQTLKCVVDY